VLQIVIEVQIVSSMIAGGDAVALSTWHDWTVPAGPHRVTVLSRVIVVSTVHVLYIVVMVNCTVAEIRNVALTKSVVTAGVLLWNEHDALMTAALIAVMVPGHSNGAQTMPVVSAWKQ